MHFQSLCILLSMLPKIINSIFSFSVLPLIAYNFMSGPFKRLWIKLGYDPRSDPCSKIYQSLDIRVPKNATVIESHTHSRVGGVDSSSGEVNKCLFFCINCMQQAKKQHNPISLERQKVDNIQLKCCTTFFLAHRKILLTYVMLTIDSVDTQTWCHQSFTF